MSKLYKEGKIRAIGVSNFYADKITDFCTFNDIKPAVNQIEMHPFFQKVDEQKINNDLGVAVQSWASFAEGQNGIFKNELLSQIGKKYGKPQHKWFCAGWLSEMSSSYQKPRA